MKEYDIAEIAKVKGVKAAYSIRVDKEPVVDELTRETLEFVVGYAHVYVCGQYVGARVKSWAEREDGIHTVKIITTRNLQGDLEQSLYLIRCPATEVIA